MQVSSTLIAAQQAAREAQSRFQAQHVAQQQAAPAGPGFAAALGAAGESQGFAPLPLRQAVAAPRPSAAPGSSFLGTRLDITI